MVLNTRACSIQDDNKGLKRFGWILRIYCRWQSPVSPPQSTLFTHLPSFIFDPYFRICFEVLFSDHLSPVLSRMRKYTAVLILFALGLPFRTRAISILFSGWRGNATLTTENNTGFFIILFLSPFTEHTLPYRVPTPARASNTSTPSLDVGFL